MSKDGARGVYEELGINPVINAMGNMTILGGSRIGPSVQAAMEQANEFFADMQDLLDKSGQAIAKSVGAEAAYITSGCFASLVLSAAGIMTGKDPEKIAGLPDTTGMKNEFLIQKLMRYHYDRCVSVPGGKLVEVGDAQGTTAKQLEAAIGPKTAGILYSSRAEGTPGTLSIPQVVEIARSKGVALLFDSASDIYPPERMTSLPKMADLVCFGGKYFGSVNSSGFVCGRRELVEAAALNGFMAYETKDNHCLGRGYKMDRQEIVGLVVAVREWFTVDHEQRLRVQKQRIQTIRDALAGLPFVRPEPIKDGPTWLNLKIIIDEAGLGKSVAAVSGELKAGTPSIWVGESAASHSISLAVHLLRDGEAELIGSRLRKALSK